MNPDGSPRSAPLAQPPRDLSRRAPWFSRVGAGLLSDLRQALRQLRKNKGLATATLATLALCIGTTTAIFSMVYSLMLKPLPFHEAGHILFGFFGRFIGVLGGSLMQLLVPAIVLCAFVYRRNVFGGAVGLWWLGESCLDLAPYIDDARAGQLMLLGGVTGREVEDYQVEPRRFFFTVDPHRFDGVRDEVGRGVNE